MGVQRLDQQLGGWRRRTSPFPGYQKFLRASRTLTRGQEVRPGGAPEAQSLAQVFLWEALPSSPISA